MHRLAFIFILLVTFTHLSAQEITLSGMVVDSAQATPIPFVSIQEKNTGTWINTDRFGKFSLKIPHAHTPILIFKSLGYEVKTIQLPKNLNQQELRITLSKTSLQIEDVQVLGQVKDELSNSYEISREALDHLQMINLNDIQQLLPGGKTNTQQHLATSTTHELRLDNGQALENGNPSFGIGIISDGFQLSPNTRTTQSTSGGRGYGIDTRSIPVGNIQSIEVITGVPSVEYGDINNGLVQIHTKKGQSKYQIDYTIKPNIKQLLLSKGFLLRKDRGVLNIDFTNSKSIAAIQSPYTTYKVNALALKYSNNRELFGKPFEYEVKLDGNIGGYNNENDPDLIRNTYIRESDNFINLSHKTKWLLNKKWITNLETSGGIQYTHNINETQIQKSFAASTAAIHSMQTGYFIGQLYTQNPNAEIILIPRGYWYEKRFHENKPLNLALKLKGTLHNKLSGFKNLLNYGIEYKSSGNFGRGAYYDQYEYAPTWRPYSYRQEPFINNFSLYAEDNVRIPIDKYSLELRAGLRHDMTYVNQSEYGMVHSLSPRVNSKFVFVDNPKHPFLKHISLGYGFGKMVKQPAPYMLYTIPQYRDQLAFTPGTTVDGDTFYAYHTGVRTRIFNPELRWQYSLQHDIDFHIRTDIANIKLSAGISTTHRPYESIGEFERFAYNYTGQEGLEGIAIAEADRKYSIDQTTGVVTVHDITGTNNPIVLPYQTKEFFISSQKIINGSSTYRKNLLWNISFKPISPIRTTLLVDGALYDYQGLDNTVYGYTPGESILMSDRRPYRYVAFFAGGRSSSNGFKNNRLDLNLSAKTHIPKLRLVFTSRIEATVINTVQNLSQYTDGSQRGYVLDNRDAYLPSASDKKLHDGDSFGVVYPEYYISYDDPHKKIPFYSTFLWAAEDDPNLFNDLSRLVQKSNTSYYFKRGGTSFYYSVNLGISKEIGDFMKISFNATNFNNTLTSVKNKANGMETSLFESTSIPKLYYGLSLSLKI